MMIIIKRCFLTIAILLIASVSFAQLNGNFYYAQDGHIYFSLANTLRYPITFNAVVCNYQTNESRADRITILNGQQFIFGPNAGWVWMKGEVFTVTYSDGRTVVWTCPQTDPTVANNNQNNYGYNGGNYGGGNYNQGGGGNFSYFNNQSTPKSSQGNNNRGWAQPVKVSFTPQIGTYKFSDNDKMFYVYVKEKNGYKEVNINHSNPIPGLSRWGSFTLDKNGILSPRHSEGGGMFEDYNKYQFNFGPNMSYLVFNGKKYYKATKQQEDLHLNLGSAGIQAQAESRAGQSRPNSSSSKETHGTRMVKCKNPTCVDGYNKTPEYTRNPSVSYPPYTHSGGFECPYCRINGKHYHSRCSSCLTNKGLMQESY